MNKNIIKTIIPAVAAALAMTTTGCVATRCYERHPTARLETTYITTPVVGTTYATAPIIETVYEPIYVRTPVYRTVPPPPRRPRTFHRAKAPHRTARTHVAHRRGNAMRKPAMPNARPKTNHPIRR